LMHGTFNKGLGNPPEVFASYSPVGFLLL